MNILEIVAWVILFFFELVTLCWFIVNVKCDPNTYFGLMQYVAGYLVGLIVAAATAIKIISICFPIP